jgi:uncharacterized membrane protein
MFGLIFALIFLIVVGLGALLVFVWKQRPVSSSRPVRKEKARTGARLPFRPSYVLLPAVMLVLSLIVGAVFYSRLPEEVSFQFNSDGSTSGWVSRGIIMLWSILPQFLLVILAVAFTWGVTRISALFQQPERRAIAPEKVLLIMGNMVVLPQLVLFIAILDIFSYNAYKIHLLPLWATAAVVMVAGGIVLGILFVRAFQRSLKNTQ